MTENEPPRASSRETAPTPVPCAWCSRGYPVTAEGDHLVDPSQQHKLARIRCPEAASRAPAEPRTVSVLISAKELAALTRLANTIDNALGTRDADAVDEWITNARLMLADQRVATENDLARAPAETSVPPKRCYYCEDAATQRVDDDWIWVCDQHATETTAPHVYDDGEEAGESEELVERARAASDAGQRGGDPPRKHSEDCNCLKTFHPRYHGSLECNCAAAVVAPVEPAPGGATNG